MIYKYGATYNSTAERKQVIQSYKQVILTTFGLVIVLTSNLSPQNLTSSSLYPTAPKL